jgi:hypothetical protein
MTKIEPNSIKKDMKKAERRRAVKIKIMRQIEAKPLSALTLTDVLLYESLRKDLDRDNSK